jgi:hypothetical protein
MEEGARGGAAFGLRDMPVVFLTARPTTGAVAGAGLAG